MRRRNFITAVAATATAVAQTPPTGVQRKGRLKQCAMRVNFDPKMSFDDMCRIAAGLGCKGFDLIGKQDWPTLRKYGLVPTMANSAPVTIQDGLIRKELHDSIEKGLHAVTDECAEGGCPNIITVGGRRRGISHMSKARTTASLF